MGAAIIIILAMLFSSCEVLKTKRQVTRDSTVTAKVDSGKLNIQTVNIKDSLAWWKETFNFSRDTTIVNNNVYPTSYIRERGVRTVETKSVNYDSLWSVRLDSLSYRISEATKTKETKVLSMWQIIGLAVGVCLVFLLITKLKIR